MKVLMVTPFYYPIIGGTESFIESISIKLNEKGINTDIMSFNVDRKWKPWSISQIKKSETTVVNCLNIKRVSALTFLPTRLIFRVNFIPGRFLDKVLDYDILHFHNDIDLSFPLFSRSINKPKLFHCHCLHLTYNSYKRNPLQKRLFKRVADVYIVPSNFWREKLIELGIPETKIEIVPNGIDVENFKPCERNRVENLLLFVGRLDPEKGLLVLLKALNYLKTSVQLVIIGPPSRPWFFKKLLMLIRAINESTTHKVVYMGVLKTDDVIRWYQRASVFVCPSLSELFGIVNLEALSCATPVVATNVGGIPEVVKDHQNGILVPPNNAAKLAEGIQYLLDNENVRKKLGENGRKWVIDNFSSDVIAKSLFQIYKALM
ncbi:MAG: glycosyltransferase family 4 protein [Candidatus Baldrarchaeia archaeon]